MADLNDDVWDGGLLNGQKDVIGNIYVECPLKLNVDSVLTVIRSAPFKVFFAALLMVDKDLGIIDSIFVLYFFKIMIIMNFNFWVLSNSIGMRMLLKG